MARKFEEKFKGKKIERKKKLIKIKDRFKINKLFLNIFFKSFHFLEINIA